MEDRGSNENVWVYNTVMMNGVKKGAVILWDGGQEARFGVDKGAEESTEIKKKF